MRTLFGALSNSFGCCVRVRMAGIDRRPHIFVMGTPSAQTCPRCFSERGVVAPWRGYRYVRRVWLTGMGLIVAFSPILASDIFVMLPLSVVYLLAGGPALALAKQEPTCRDCGLAVPAGGLRFARPCRLVPKERPTQKEVAVRAVRASSQARAAVATQAQHDDESGVRTLPGRDE